MDLDTARKEYKKGRFTRHGHPGYITFLAFGENGACVIDEESNLSIWKYNKVDFSCLIPYDPAYDTKVYPDGYGLEPGIYRIHWKDGGDCVAAVGSLNKGLSWMSPCSAMGFDEEPKLDESWDRVAHAVLLLSAKHDAFFSGPLPVRDES